MTTKLRDTDQEKMEIDLQQLRADQELILSQIDNAIALFDSSDCLVLFNKKLAETWGLSSEWLATKPKCDLLFAEIVDRGYLSLQQWEQFQQALQQSQDESLSFYLEQSNAVCLEVFATITNNGGRLFTFRDVTVYQNSQASLNAKVTRLSFLLGLTEIQAGDHFLEGRLLAANVLVRTKNVDAAIKMLDDVPDLIQEQQILVLQSEANLLSQAKRNQESFDMLQKAQQTWPDAIEITYDYAMAAERVGKLDVMESELRKVIQKKPDFAAAYNALGYSFADRNIKLVEAKN